LPKTKQYDWDERQERLEQPVGDDRPRRHQVGDADARSDNQNPYNADCGPNKGSIRDTDWPHINCTENAEDQVYRRLDYRATYERLVSAGRYDTGGKRAGDESNRICGEQHL